MYKLNIFNSSNDDHYCKLLLSYIPKIGEEIAFMKDEHPMSGLWKIDRIIHPIDSHEEIDIFVSPNDESTIEAYDHLENKPFGW